MKIIAIFLSSGNSEALGKWGNLSAQLQCRFKWMKICQSLNCHCKNMGEKAFCGLDFYYWWANPQIMKRLRSHSSVIQHSNFTGGSLGFITKALFWQKTWMWCFVSLSHQNRTGICSVRKWDMRFIHTLY